MENKLPEFLKIWHNDKAALIDPQNKVCLGVSRRIAEHLSDLTVQEKLYPIWLNQVELQREIERSHEKINTVYLAVTRQCNINCDFCAINANRGVNIEQEIGILDVRNKIIPFFKENCPHKLIVTGGEPLIKYQIIEIITLLHEELQCPITLQSNGIIFNKDIVEGLKGKIREIDFSTKHMFFNAKMKAELREHIEMCKKAGISVALSFIYDKENKLDLFDVIDIAAEYNTKLIVNIAAPVGRARENFESFSDLSKIEMNLEIAKYIYDKNYENKPLFNITQQMIQVRDSCGAYGRVMAIFPEGDIYLCQCLENDNYKVGNILLDSAEKICEKFRGLLQQKTIMESFCVQKKAICKECDYRFLCGGKCPVSSDKDTFTCYYIKGMINFQLFYLDPQISNRQMLKLYIKYLTELMKYYPSRTEKMHFKQKTYKKKGKAGNI